MTLAVIGIEVRTLLGLGVLRLPILSIADYPVRRSSRVARHIARPVVAVVLSRCEAVRRLAYCRIRAKHISGRVCHIEVSVAVAVIDECLLPLLRSSAVSPPLRSSAVDNLFNESYP